MAHVNLKHRVLQVGPIYESIVHKQTTSQFYKKHQQRFKSKVKESMYLAHTILVSASFLSCILVHEDQAHLS
jgi:hypothetical protein